MSTADSLVIEGINLSAVLPEVILTVGGLTVLIAGASLKKDRPGVLSGLAVVTLLGGVVAAASLAGNEVLAFGDLVAIDGFSAFFKVVLGVVGLVAVLASIQFLKAEDVPSVEYLGLILFGTAGMMLMTSATDLLMVFVALETFSLALYVLAAFRRNRPDSQEGALKYFVTGSFSSAFFLYGTALVYGAVGSTRFGVINERISQGAGLGRELLVAGVGLLIVGLAFKVAAVPFHMWTPDAYQGSPSPVAGFMAAGSKIAGFAVLARLLVTTLGPLVDDWRPVIVGIAAITMILGSVVAVVQSNVKRMLAYSSIAHSGFLLLGVAAANPRGISASLFYLAAYSLVIVGAFTVTYAVGGAGEKLVRLEDYRGLWSSRPFLASGLALFLISLAGIPPTSGFWAKFEVFSAAADAGLYPLVVIGVLTSAVAAFFYLRVIVQMFLESPKEWMLKPEGTVPSTGAAMLIAMAVVALGIYPGPLLELARHSGIPFIG